LLFALFFISLVQNLIQGSSLAIEEMKVWALETGNYLAKNVRAGTAEEALLKELWDAAAPEERKTSGTLIFKLVG